MVDADSAWENDSGPSWGVPRISFGFAFDGSGGAHSRQGQGLCEVRAAGEVDPLRDLGGDRPISCELLRLRVRGAARQGSGGRRQMGIAPEGTRILC